MADLDRSIEVLNYLKQYCKDSGRKKLPKIAEIASNFQITEYETGKWLRLLISTGFLTLKYNHWGFSQEVWDEIDGKVPAAPAAEIIKEPAPAAITLPVIPQEPEHMFIRIIEGVLHNQKTSYYIIFAIAMAISCFLVGQMGWGISNHLFTQIACLVIFVFIELVGQFCLGRGKFFRKQKSKQQCIYFTVFAIYVLVFSIPASVGFFSSELNAQAAAITRTDNSTARAETRLGQISNMLILQSALLAGETNSGYGPRAKTILGNISELTGEETRLYALLDAPSARPMHAERQMYFQTLSKALWGLPEAFIKVLMFGVAMVMLQFAIIVSCPAFGVKGKEE